MTWNAQELLTISIKTSERISVGKPDWNSTKNPIVDAQNPFGNYFDGGMVSMRHIMPANFM